MEVLVPLVLVLAGGYFAMTSLAYFIQEKLLFQPMQGHFGTPADVGLEFEDVRLATEDGETLHAWWIPNPDARATVLFFHGNAGNLTTRLETIMTLQKLGVNVFIFDYRGYGESTGSPSEKGLYRDAEAAWYYLIRDRGLAPAEIVLHGRSMGVAVATWLAERMPEGALVAESGFTSVPDIGSHHYAYLPVRLLSRMDMDNLARIGNCRSPVLVIHSRDDEIIPFSHGERLYRAAGEPKRFVELRGDHNSAFINSRAAYIRGLQEFVDAYTPGGRPPAQEP